MNKEMSVVITSKKIFLEPKYMLKAIETTKKEILKKTKNKSGPFGACIVDLKGRIVACESNQVISKNDPTQHAEVRAISKACKKLKTICLDKCILYTTCEPCLMCRGAIYWAQIPVIVYGLTQKDARAIGFDEINITDKQFAHIAKRKVKIIKNYMRNECMELFEIYKKNKGIVY